MVRRRSFLIGCSSLAAAPALAGGVAHSSAASSAASTAPATSPSPDETGMLALRIAGWDTAEPQRMPAGELWMQINSSWQVAWR